jgi:glycosyltransferase involved in cell wall biosynthesis
MKKLTVFTPTYNRAYCLHQLYESLLRQTNSDFVWMLIDDGSTDNTRDLLKNWMLNKKIEIVYIYQENQGMHGAHNTAYENIKTELNVCIDSDDYMTDDAVAIILEEFKNVDKTLFAGIVALDADKKGGIIGTSVPENLSHVKLHELYLRHGVKGDKKLVFFNDKIKNIPPYPLFKGERFVPLDYKYLLLNQKYYLKPVNKVLCIVEYQVDGSTMNIFKQYRKNPKGFAFSRISRIDYGLTFVEKIKNSVHLVSSVLFSGDFSDLFKTKHTSLVLVCFPIGLLFNIYVRYKTSSSKRK